MNIASLMQWLVQYSIVPVLVVFVLAEVFREGARLRR